MSEAKHEVLARYEQARTAMDPWRSDLRDAFRFCQPGSTAFAAAAGGAAGSSARPIDTTVYDTTAAEAVEEFSARMAHALGVGFSSLVRLEPGAEWTASASPEQIQDMQSVLEDLRDTIDGYLQRSNLETELLPALTSAAISTGVLLVHEGDVYSPIRFEAVPLDQVVFAEGPSGMVEHVYRHFEPLVEHVERLWSGARLSDAARAAAEKKDAKDRRVKLVEAVEYQPAGGGWTLTVVEQETGHEVVKADLSETRWVVFRIARHAGQAYGVAPALRLLPEIKTANKVVELVLKNASISVTGIWQADDDGVLNPATVKLVPGAIIPKAVGSAGLTPLQSPGNFDVSQLVLSDQRERIRRGIAGPALPGLETGIRSATEWNLREQHLVILSAPQYTRMFRELVVPIYRIAAAILGRKGLLRVGETTLPDIGIKDGHVRVVPQSPYVDMKRRGEMSARMQGVQLAAAIDPLEVQVMLDTGKAVQTMLLAHGWDANEMRPAAEQKKRREQLLAAASQQQAPGGGA